MRFAESYLQAAVCRTFGKMREAGAVLEFAGDMNAGKRGPREQALAKLTGMTAGEPDLRVYLPGGRIAFIELKGRDTKVSDEQVRRHRALERLGAPVLLLRSNDPLDAAQKAAVFVNEQLVFPFDLPTIGELARNAVASLTPRKSPAKRVKRGRGVASGG